RRTRAVRRRRSVPHQSSEPFAAVTRLRTVPRTARSGFERKPRAVRGLLGPHHDENENTRPEQGRERTLHMEAKTVTAQVGNQSIAIETGRLAKQADGSVVVRAGDSVVLVTVVSAKEKKEGLDFFPLTVGYQERLAAAGRIPGSFFRREGRLTERETLISRLIDRSCRPLFPEGYQNETQIIATVFSADNQYDTDVLALTGASYALAVSDIPFPFASEAPVSASTSVPDRESTRLNVSHSPI